MKQPLIDYGDTEEARVFDLSAEGFPCVPALGITRSRKSKPADPEHTHPGCLEIILCLRGGNLSVSVGGESLPFRPGSVFVSRPDQPHHLDAAPKGLYLYWLLFHLPRGRDTVLGLSVAESRWLAARLTTMPLRMFVGNESIRTLFRRLFALRDGKDLPGVGRRLLMRNAILELLLETAAAAAIAPLKRPNARVEDVMRQMRAEPGLDYPADVLARRLSLSPGNLNAAFKQLTGLPPHAFLLHCRIARAQEELRKNGCSVTALAGKLGFRSYRHFSAQFKAVTGVLPSKWR